MGPRCRAEALVGTTGLQTRDAPREQRWPGLRRGHSAFSLRILLSLPPSVLVGSSRAEQPAAPNCDEFFHLVNSELVGAGQVTLRQKGDAFSWFSEMHKSHESELRFHPVRQSHKKGPGKQRGRSNFKFVPTAVFLGVPRSLWKLSEEGTQGQHRCAGRAARPRQRERLGGALAHREPRAEAGSGGGRCVRRPGCCLHGCFPSSSAL